MTEFFTILVWTLAVAVTIWCIYFSIKTKAWAWLVFLIGANALVYFWNPDAFWPRVFEVVALLGLYIIAKYGQEWLDLKREMRETQRELDELNEEPV